VLILLIRVRHQAKDTMELARWFTLVFFVVMPPSNSLETFYIDKTGYEHCILNLVDYNSRNTADATDLTESIMAQNLGFQLWTVTMLPHEKYELQNITEDSDWVIHTDYLRESCSINFLVATKGPYFRSAYLIFGSRFFYTKNTLIVYLTEYDEIENLSFGLPNIAAINIFVFSVSNTSAYAFDGLFLCPSCPPDSVATPVTVKSLAKMKKNAEKVKRRSLLPVVLYTLPKIVDNQSRKGETFSCVRGKGYTEPFTKNVRLLLGCLAISRFVNSIASRFNWTTTSIEVQETSALIMIRRPNFFRGVAVPNNLQPVIGSKFIPYENFLSEYHHDTQIRKFIYCPENLQRKAFNIMFWTLPLDSLTWAGIGIALIIVSILLKGNWTEAIAIILRQPASVLEENKVLVVLMLVCVVITSGYESIISGVLTVPPPFNIMSSLKELIDNGFEIIGGDTSARSPELKELFERENITSHSLESRFDRDFTAVADILLTLVAGNITMPYNFYKGITRRVIINKICYFAPETEFSKNNRVVFSGNDRGKLYKAMGCLVETGIMRMYKAFYNYFDNRSTWKKQDYFLSLESQPVAFELSDWKISSIFIVWGGLVGFAGTVFIAEVFNNNVISTLYSLARAFKRIETRLVVNLRNI